MVGSPTICDQECKRITKKVFAGFLATVKEVKETEEESMRRKRN